MLKHMTSEQQEILTVVVNLIQNTAFELIERDPHQWSSRPCPTCKAVSSLIQRPFGCSREGLK